MADNKRIEELRTKTNAIITAGLLDGDPYDDAKDYIEAMESENVRLAVELETAQKELIDYPHMCKVADGQMNQNQRLRKQIDELTAELEKYRAAEQGGRLVMLPNIPYNKTLYWIWGDEIMPVRYKGIRGGCITKDGIYHVTCNMATKKARSFPYTHRGKPGVNTYLAGDKRMFYADDIGKTIFFAKAAAEQTLNERKDGESQ